MPGRLDATNIFVKFLPHNIGDDYLHKLFAPYGSVVSAKVMVDPYSQESLGYGYAKQKEYDV